MEHFNEEDLMDGIEVIISNAVNKYNPDNPINKEVEKMLLEVYKENIDLLIAMANRAYEDNKGKIEKADLLIEIKKVSCINMIESVIREVTEKSINED